MGQKVNPTGFRTGIMLDWQSTWYAGKADFAELLVEDVRIRAYILAYRSIETVKIERQLGFTHSHNDEDDVLQSVGVDGETTT